LERNRQNFCPNFKIERMMLEPNGATVCVWVAAKRLLAA
jgi:ribosomal protein L28